MYLMLLRYEWRCRTFRSLRFTNRTNSLCRCYAHSRACCRCWSFRDTTGRPHSNGNISIASSLLPLNNNEGVSQTSHGQASCYPSLVMVIESNSATAAIGSPNGPILAKVTVVLGPELVLCSIAIVIAVEGLCRIVRRIVLCKRLHNVEFYSWVACEPVQSQI